MELGAVPYSLLHQVYRECDIYVTPAYAESFAHPLVEGMASGSPIVASDLAVHREICQDAAIYFQRFSPAELADQICRVAAENAVQTAVASRAGAIAILLVEEARGRVAGVGGGVAVFEKGARELVMAEQSLLGLSSRRSGSQRKSE